MSLDKHFTNKDLSISEEETAYKGFFKIKKYLLKHNLFNGGESAEFTRELFCRGRSVGVLLYDPEKELVGLAKQFRIGCLDNEHGPWVWEVIAGINDKNEAPEQVAIREAKEESDLNIKLEQLMPICSYYNSPGGSDERLHLFCAITSLDIEERVMGVKEENEDILFKPFAYTEAISAMLKGTINNAATIICLQWLQLNKAKLEGQFCSK